jgi:hypothetical protein
MPRKALHPSPDALWFLGFLGTGEAYALPDYRNEKFRISKSTNFKHI